MRNLHLLLFVALAFYACSDDVAVMPAAAVPPSCRITSVDNSALRYDDIQINAWGVVAPRQIAYDATGRAVSVTGGLQAYGGFGSLGNWNFAAAVRDTVMYSGEDITVKHSYKESGRPYDKIYKVRDGQLLQRTVTVLYPGTMAAEVFTYSHLGNQMVETAPFQPTRTFDFENDNLVRISWEKTGYGDMHPTRYEMLFENYDDKPNPLKGMFFLNGSFYRNFSRNNFRKISWNTYKMQDGAYVLWENAYLVTDFGYDADGFADFVQKQCN